MAPRATKAPAPAAKASTPRKRSASPAKAAPPAGPPAKSVDELVADGVALVREYLEVDSRRTDILRSLSLVVVGLRSSFIGAGGKRDWAGQTPGYRNAVKRIYDEAGIPSDSLNNTQAALRYHIGNTLREFAPARELKAAGLKSESPRERAAISQGRKPRGSVAVGEPDRKATAVLRGGPPLTVEEQAEAHAKAHTSACEMLESALALIVAATNTAITEEEVSEVARMCGEISQAAIGLMAGATLQHHGVIDVRSSDVAKAS